MSGAEPEGARCLLCPHCSEQLPASWSPRRAGRCPTCQLVIGGGRASSSAEAGRGSAASILANQARRADQPAGDPAALADGLRRAAASLGADPNRLRMLDYQELQLADPSLSPLAEVLATFGTWKQARAAAALAG